MKDLACMVVSVVSVAGIVERNALIVKDKGNKLGRVVGTNNYRIMNIVTMQSR